MSITFPDRRVFPSREWRKYRHPLGAAEIAPEEDDARAALHSPRSTVDGSVVLRWHLDTGVVVIPKPAEPERIASNFDLVDFTLSDDEVARINGLSLL